MGFWGGLGRLISGPSYNSSSDIGSGNQGGSGSKQKVMPERCSYCLHYYPAWSCRDCTGHYFCYEGGKPWCSHPNIRQEVNEYSNCKLGFHKCMSYNAPIENEFEHFLSHGRTCIDRGEVKR